MRTRIIRENVGALLAAQKNSASVSDGISAESIRKTPDRNTSEVIRRVSGASIQDDRFAIIRGLNDRYNAAFLNAAPLPSSESDRKAFAFNIFPSNILDNLIIYKTGTPDMSGEFGGGLVHQ
ncbi:MAG: TonB-dependent receptor plug domain-containing protein [Segetibacter sp.]